MSTVEREIDIVYISPCGCLFRSQERECYMTTPKVSVLTPIYNTNPKHLREMIESILNQTFTDFEFLILNDSPENTELDKIVNSYRDSRIVYSKNDKNIGISASRNKLLKMARGEYIAIFDHDDISVPDRLAQEVEYLDMNPQIGVVSGWLQYFGRKNFILKTKEFDSEIRILLSDHCAIMHTAAMVRKSVLMDNNIEYDENYTPNEDHWLWVCLMDVTHFHNIQQVLVKYRWYNNNTSKQQSSKMSANYDRIQEYVSNKYPFLRRRFEKEYDRGTRFRLLVLGIIPLLKIKHNWLFLFGFIPVLKIKWR